MIKSKKKFFDIQDEIDKSPNTRVFYVVGQRGVGKSYSVKMYVLRQLFLYDKQFIYNRRWTTEISNGEMITIFDDVSTDPEIDKCAYEFCKRHHYGEFYAWHILPKAGNFWFVGEQENGELKWLCIAGKITCVSKAQSVKGNVLNMNYNSVMFDEFITEMGYVHGKKEPELFAKLVNTAARANNDLKIFMLGNPDANIELNPYINGSNIVIDYAHLQNNTAYYYDRVVNGKRLANNVMFIKLAGFEGETYLNEATAGVWNTAEEEMSVSGEVKTGKYISLDQVEEKDLRVYYKIIMETPVVANDEYRKKIYCYYGYWSAGGCREPVTIILGHDSAFFNKQLRNDKYIIYSRVDELDIRPRPYLQMYRFNLPNGERFAWLHKIIDGVRVNRLLLTDNNTNASTYEQIILQSE